MQRALCFHNSVILYACAKLFLERVLWNLRCIEYVLGALGGCAAGLNAEGGGGAGVPCCFAAVAGCCCC